MTFTQTSTTTEVPTLAIISPSSDSYINLSNVSSFTVSGTCSGKETTVTVKIDGSTTLGSANCASGIWSLSSLNMMVYSESAHTFTADLNDNTGAILARANVSVTKDTYQPAASPLSINAGAPRTAFHKVTLSLYAFDPTLPISTCIIEGSSCSGCTLYTNQPTLPTQVPFQVGTGFGTKSVSVSYKDAAGNSTCMTSSINLQTPLLAVNPLYPLGLKWNDYVKSSDTSQPCVGDETGTNPCIHGGEKRSVVVSTENSCAGLEMTDDTEVFNWSCSDNNGAGPAEFRSSLKQGKGLRDLLTSTPAWVQKSVTLRKSGSNDTYSSPLSTWWTNPITPLSDLSALTNISSTLATDSMIYIIPTGITITTPAGVQIGANRVSLVTLGNGALNWNSTGTANCVSSAKKCLLYTPYNSTKAFLWIEGNFIGTANNTDDYGIYFFGTTFSKIVNTGATLMNTGIYFENSNYNAVLSTASFNNTSNGIELVNSTTNSLFNLRLTNNGQDGMLLRSSSKGNIVSNINSSNNGGTGIHLSSTTITSNNSFSKVLAFANGGSGMKFDSISDGNRVSAATVSNNHGDGIELDNSFSNILLNIVSANNELSGFRLNDAQTNTISQYAFAHNTTGVLVSETTFGSTGIKFTDNFLYGNNGTNCFDNTAQPAITSSCTKSGSSTFTAAVNNLSLSSAFVGRVMSDDSINTSDNYFDGSIYHPGEALFTALNSPTGDWLGFMNFFRGWGLSGSSFPYSDDRGRCGTGETCRIWDWSLLAGSSMIRNTSGTGSTQNSTNNGGNYVFPVDPAACPPEVAGSVYITPVLGPNYLKNAAEMIGAGGSNNGDGLCQSNENCLYTPNFGAYQGHGTLAECTFNPNYDPWPIMNVKMFGYTSNGY